MVVDFTFSVVMEKPQHKHDHTHEKVEEDQSSEEEAVIKKEEEIKKRETGSKKKKGYWCFHHSLNYF